MSTSTHSTTVAETEIKFDRITKDFAVLVGGRVIGYGASYRAAEELRTAYLASLLEMPEGDILDAHGMRVAL